MSRDRYFHAPAFLLSFPGSSLHSFTLITYPSRRRGDIDIRIRALDSTCGSTDLP